MRSYNEVIQRKLQTTQSSREMYSYTEPELERAFAFARGHSTSKRPRVVTTLPQNFPIFSSLTSTRVGLRSAAAQQVLVDLDYGMHVLETLTAVLQQPPSSSGSASFPSHSGPQGRGGPQAVVVMLLGEWARAERALASSGLLAPNDVVRAVAQPPHPLTSEADWILTLQTWRAEIPLGSRLVVFFDQPCAATHPTDFAALAKLQMVMLYLLHPDAALLRFSLPPGKSNNRLYPAGRLVLPMSDDPQVEQLLLLTTAEEYDARVEVYPAAKIRDQFAYFARETVPRVDYRDLASGTRTTYLARRQQEVLFALRRRPAAGLPGCARGEEEEEEEGVGGGRLRGLVEGADFDADRWWVCDAPAVPCACIELGGAQGYLAVVAGRLGPAAGLPGCARGDDAGGQVGADEDEDVENAQTHGEKVEMLHVATWTRVFPAAVLLPPQPEVGAGAGAGAETEAGDEEEREQTWIDDDDL